MSATVKKQTGFTIVELLIVIVVIAILATISVVAYSVVQGRARDSQRLNDMKTIVQALEMYRAEHGRYPSSIATPPVATIGSYEFSAGPDGPTNFLSALVTSDTLSKVPVDPVNRYASGGTANFDNKVYVYLRMSAGNWGCDADKGAFYILAVQSMDTVARRHPDSPGFSCSNVDSTGRYAWVTGKFENE